MCTDAQISQLWLLLCMALMKLAMLHEKWIMLHKEVVLHTVKSIHNRRALSFTAVQENARILTAFRLAKKPRLRTTRRFWMLKR